MEQTPDRGQLLLRLALCGGGAALLYGAALSLPALEEHRPWLEEHKLQAVALGAAALFGLSLAIFPRKEEAPPPGGCGYEMVE